MEYSSRAKELHNSSEGCNHSSFPSTHRIWSSQHHLQSSMGCASILESARRLADHDAKVSVVSRAFQATAASTEHDILVRRRFAVSLSGSKHSKQLSFCILGRYLPLLPVIMHGAEIVDAAAKLEEQRRRNRLAQRRRRESKFMPTPLLLQPADQFL